jgi:hypothetical protein
MNWLVSAGAIVSKPLFENPDYDLVADFGGRLVRVQVKTSTCRKNDRFVVALCTRGGNQSWNGIVKRLDATRCDALFVHVGDGRRVAWRPLTSFATLDWATRRDSRAVKGDAL